MDTDYLVAYITWINHNYASFPYSTVLADTQTTASIIFSCLLVLASANLSKDSLQSVAADRPVFIKAYAPWCGTNAIFIP